MIAYLGEIIFNSVSLSTIHPTTTQNRINDKKNSKLIYSSSYLDKVDIKPRQRTDDIKVSWRN